MSKLFDASYKLPWVASFKTSNDDEYSDRLNHRFTVGFLLVCASLGLGAPYIFERITCWVPAQFVGAYTKYTNSYCWIANTYYVPSNETVPHSTNARERAEIGYYQWTPFIFLLCAFFFYLPRMLWRSMNTRSGIDLQFLVTKAVKDEDKGEKALIDSIEYYCTPKENGATLFNRLWRTIFCTSGKRLGNYLRSMYLIVKFLYLINSIIQLILIQMVLGQPGWFYGIDIWHSIFVRNSVLTDSPYFPRVTLCDLRIREVGNLHRYTVQCVLPINMLNEKMFSLTWFWLVYVFIANLFSFISALYNTIIPRSRINFIRNLYNTSSQKSISDSKLLEKFVQDFLMQDGALIIEIIYHNGSAIRATKLVNALFSNYQKKEPENQTKQQEREQEVNSENTNLQSKNSEV